jgi:hypothetical protein
MALKMPKDGHPVRELIDCAEVVGMSETAYKLLPSVTEARADARAYFKAQPPDVLYTHMLVRHEDGQVLLMSFGRKGGYKTRWNFGRHSSVKTHRERAKM